MEITGYDLSRAWFDFCFENPEKINPNHTALYMFCIEHCNRLGWKEKFGLPTTMVMEAIGVRSYNTYIKNFNDLIEFGFIKLVEKSKNQYSSNIIALSNFDKALDKALDKASIKHSINHSTKQSESTVQSNYSIIKQINIEQLNIEHITILKNIIKNFEEKNSIQEEEIIKETCFSFNEFWDIYPKKVDKKAAEQKYAKLSEEKRQKIKDTIDAFIVYKPFPTYNLPNPSTYINKERWNDVITPEQNKDPFYREPIVDRTHGFSVQF